jgi:protein disulfide-isomerase A6
MKPDWDALADEFASSSTVVIADVDCTGTGESLCQRMGVEGYPTIKSFSPPDTEGDDYSGGRDLAELREFASSLGPGCSVVTKEHCSTEELQELEALLATPAAELSSELEELKQKVDDAQSTHDELLEDLQAKYEASETSLEELKKELKPRMKLLRAATATAAPAAVKDEM